MLYNKKNKDAFIDDTLKGKEEKAYRQSMTACFKNTAAKEYEKDKDICLFTVEELKDFYLSLKTASFLRLTVIDSQLKRYAAWSVEKEIIDLEDNKIKNITQEDLLQCVVIQKDNIISREKLIEEISILPNIGEQFLCLALFEGIAGKEYCELVNLKKGDFESKDGKWIAHLIDRDLEITEELVLMGLKAADTEKMYLYTKDLSFVESYYKNDGEEKTRVIKNPPQTFKSSAKTDSIRIKGKLTRINAYLENPAITRSNLLESGRIDLVKRLMKADGETDLRNTLRKYNKTEIMERYGYIQNMQRWAEQYGKYIGG